MIQYDDIQTGYRTRIEMIDTIKMKKMRFVAAILLCCALFAAACAGTGTPPKDKGGDKAASGTAQAGPSTGMSGDHGAALAAQGVRLPVSRPSIYVDQTGYVAGQDKRILFVGGQYGETFDVVRASDGQVVHIAKTPESRQDPQSGQVFGVAELSGLDAPGTYYIRTDIIGQSYPFTIAQDTYEDLFLNVLRNLSAVPLDESPAGVRDVCFGMHATMHALQCNGTLFEAAYEHLGEDEQDKQLVAQLLYMTRWLIAQQRGDGSIYGDQEATAAFCGVIMMSRDNFGRYEANVDREYREAAQKAWDWLGQQAIGTDAQARAQFYAASQMFKSDGGDGYRTIAEGYLREKKEDYATDPFVFYGVLSYMSAGKGTDRDLCTHIMLDIAERTEDICAAAKEDQFFGTGARTLKDNMSHMLYLSFVDHLMPSKEYTSIIENSIQYMGGINENGICYIGKDGRWANVEEVSGRSFEWNGIMLLALSDMLYNLR